MKIKSPSICVSIFDTDVNSLVEKVNSLKDVDLIEIRADYLRKIDVETVKEMFRNIDNKIPKIFTLRSKKEGGYYNGEESERINIILEAINHAEIIDIELSTNENYIKDVVRKCKDNNCSLIISYHNFSETPKDEIIKDIINRERMLGADICKIATQIKTKMDIIRLARILLDENRNDLCILGMGEYGKITRILFPYLGSVIVYAYYDKPTAKGQIHYKDMKKIFKILEL